MKPDPDFLYKLSLPLASVLPTGAPVPSGPPGSSGAISEPVIPGTAPYRVNSVRSHPSAGARAKSDVSRLP
jgi:hypothetical protein